MSSLKGGKTPPRLLDDLCIYNPDRLPMSGYNILTELAYPFDPDQTNPPRTVGKGSCRHRWYPKTRQTSTDLIDTQTPRISVAGAYCLDCRTHVRLMLDTTRAQPGGGACPNGGYPLHHFRYKHGDDCGLRKNQDSTAGWRDDRVFECSSFACAATLRVSVYSPRLSREHVTLLTDRALIKERAQEAMSADPKRFEGHATPSPLNVIATLKAYVDNSFKMKDMRIKDNNKKWLLCLGERCRSLVESIGFTREEEHWIPPSPEHDDEEPFTNPVNILLDDIMGELDALMNREPEDEKRGSKVLIDLTPDSSSFLKLLGSDNYRKSLSSRTASNSPGDEHPWYAGLGAVLDFHDSLISFAYDRQISCDLANNSYYLDSLSGIAEGRKSEDLKTKAAIEASTGKLSNTEIREAYASFNLDMHSEGLSDDHIIGTFQSRAPDAPLQEAELRRNLTIIGQHRQSQKIEEFAANTVTTYEQALSWLGASADMDDSFIIAMFGVKQNENPAYEDLARTCVKMIADHRQSSALQQWLNTGNLGDIAIDIPQAYQILNIQDRTIEDNGIIAAYLGLTGDSPNQEHRAKEALRVIAEDRGSHTLRAMLGDEVDQREKGSEGAPVGLQNIGNTCYLNSILQYYFSIKPVRDLILNFDIYKEDLNDPALRDKRVGGRKINADEALRAQTLATELRQLFQEMVESPYKKVQPRKELAALTIFSKATEEDVDRRRRQSFSEPKNPTSQAEAMANVPDDIPEEAVDDNQPDHDQTTSQALDNGDVMEEDVDSVSTLVDKAHLPNSDMTKTTDEIGMEGITSVIDEMPPAESPEQLVPPDDLAASKNNGSSVIDSVTAAIDSEALSEDIQMFDAPERTPPAVPTRVNNSAKQDKLLRNIEFEASQKDVYEVIDNLRSQLQGAVRPTIRNANEKMIDVLEHLFYGRSRYSSAGEKTKAAVEEFQEISVSMVLGARDIYEALDAVYDEANVSTTSGIVAKHQSIVELPQILQIYVGRVAYDKESKKSLKTRHHLTLRSTIYMDKYMEFENEELNALRKNEWKWKRELRSLKDRKAKIHATDVEMSMAEACEATADHLQDLEEDISETGDNWTVIAKNLRGVAENLKRETEDLDRRINELEGKLEAQRSERTCNFPYCLYAVFMHRGEVSFGHYWIYIHDFENNVWRKYNDGYVTVVAEDEVFSAGDDPNRPSTSTFVVYIRDGKQEELTEPICRKIYTEPLEENIETID